MMMTYAGITDGRAMIQSALQKPWDFGWNYIEKIQLPTERLKKMFMTEAFNLKPADVEPPYPPTSQEVKKVPIPHQRSVLLIQRTGYRPAVRSEYEKTERRQLMSKILEIRLWEARRTWYSFDNVSERVDFKPVEK